MRVLHIISSSGIYGAEAVILNLSRTLNAAGHASLLGVFQHAVDLEVPLHERATREGIDSTLIACKGQVDRGTISRIQELVRNTKADVVHAHGYKADVYTYLALRGSHVTLVSTCHTWYDNNLALRLYGIADRLALRRFTRVVAVSDDVRQRLLRAGIAEGKIQLVRNGIDLRRFGAGACLHAGAAAERPLIVGLVGRLSWEKGIDIFLRAASLVVGQVAGVRFVIAGDGPDREELEQLIDELKLRSHVQLLGRTEDMASLYASLDVMVSSSRQEGLPVAILEGMASGRALVATAVGEVPRLVVDGVTGSLVPPEDTGALAGGIVRLLRDEAERNRMGRNARQLVFEEYSAERMAADYLQVYEIALATGARTSRQERIANAAGSQR